jgi:uncharacterized protein (TIGR03083 family)
MGEWQFLDPSSRHNLVDAATRESEGFYELASDPDRWEAPTGAGHWQLRDVVGHLVDTTETYFIGFDTARGNGEGPENLGLPDMATLVDKGAQAFRGTPQDELIARARSARQRFNGIVDELTDDQWAGMMVPHKYMGPLPAAFYPLFQLVDYCLHSWDMREGTGGGHALEGDSADLLVPLAFILWQSTPDIPADTEPYSIGVEVTAGRNAGKHRISVSPDGIEVTEGELEDLPTVLQFDPATLVLTSYGRMNAGTVRGNQELAERFLNSFFRI